MEVARYSNYFRTKTEPEETPFAFEIRISDKPPTRRLFSRLSEMEKLSLKQLLTVGTS